MDNVIILQNNNVLCWIIIFIYYNGEFNLGGIGYIFYYRDFIFNNCMDIYMNIIIIAFVMLCLLGSACKKYAKYAKYADKLIPSIMIFNIAILIFCNYLYDNGLNQIICISSLTILVISLYKNGLRFQNGRLVNPNIIITSGFIPFFYMVSFVK